MASLRAATARDARACVAIVAGLDDHFTEDVPDKVRSDLRDHGGWVIVDGGVVVGFVIAERRGPRAAEILWAAVADARRGAGPGTRLGSVQFDTIDPLPGWPPGNPAAILAVALAPTR